MKRLALLLLLAACGGKAAPAPVDNAPVDNAGGVAKDPAVCDALAALIAAAPGGFYAVAGEQIPDRPPEGAARATTVMLPDSTCEVASIAQVSVVTCEMTGAYEAVRDEIKPCLADLPADESEQRVEWAGAEGVIISVVGETDTVHVFVVHPDDDYESPE